MGALRKLRLHFPKGVGPRDYWGRTIVEPIERTARANGTDVAGARALVARWVADGDLVPRADGGYDVHRYRPRGGT